NPLYHKYADLVVNDQQKTVEELAADIVDRVRRAA
ncbi:MAG: shikimate kinase, partial [Desulfuromonadales bacterium]|nr:shikimate kinase [Desulfuromonadales bacterium]NIS43900.1 shikimate kinase [Desulfuromonadales bacterium]